MPRPLTAGLGPGLELAPGYILRVTALDPDDGSTVSGVVVSDVSAQVDAEAPLEPLKLAPPVASFAGT